MTEKQRAANAQRQHQMMLADGRHEKHLGMNVKQLRNSKQKTLPKKVEDYHYHTNGDCTDVTLGTVIVEDIAKQQQRQELVS